MRMLIVCIMILGGVVMTAQSAPQHPA